MKLIIAGSRNIDWEDAWNNIWEFLYDHKMFSKITEIVSGGCRGVDEAGEMLAFNYDFKLKVFPANWDKYDKKAGPIRNKEMSEYVDELLLVWNGKSKGSANMKKQMEKLNKPIHEIILNG